MSKPFITIYAPESMGADVGISATIHTSNGPITLIAKGDRAMLTHYRHKAGELFNRVLGAVHKAAHDRNLFAKGDAKRKAAFVGCRNSPINQSFDLAVALLGNGQDARARLVDYKRRSEEGDDNARRAIARVRAAVAALEVVRALAQGDASTVASVEALKRDASSDSKALKKLQFLACAKARVEARPALILKDKASNGDDEAAAALEAMIAANPDMADALNYTDGPVYYDGSEPENDWDVAGALPRAKVLEEKLALIRWQYR